ncbi:MAG: (Fe-S)-binding protein [Desulfatiglans sp.]|jgi:Fe-S oxidoreductase|nr:(Fe-S)-binding protein [Thermodesulfobacteriota bacterium]MEE4353507.1 (Fe-S)-binding protein [Desulfatiglans sp.]
MNEIAELIDTTQTYYCLDCGVCTASCPVAKVYPDFSPRQIIERSLYDLEEPRDSSIWFCLTCAQCSVRCPANIDFPEFVRLFRGKAHTLGFDGAPSHNGMLQTITSIQTLGVRQDRVSWAEEGRVSEKGDVFYFVGCRPYFDVIFRDIDAGSIAGARNVLKILNACGVEPVVSNDERCCGHDALVNGDEDKFKQLARLNIDLIHASGAKKVVFSCPEGYFTFKKYYAKYFGELDFEIIHILDLINDKINEGVLSFKKSDRVVTYHDPCRLGRMAGIFDTPRNLINAIPGLEFVEMSRSRENAVCCGTTGWMNCSSCSKEIQMDRLNEAESTGADTLVTACPKCQIHFRCAQNAFDVKIEISDLLDIVVDRLQ